MRKIVSHGAEVSYVGRLFQRLAAETGRPACRSYSEVEGWHYQLAENSKLCDWSLNRDGTSTTQVK